MIDAKDALHLFNIAIDNSLVEVYRKIEVAANSGKEYVIIEELTEEQERRLKDLGYRISKINDYEISW